ncbi:MAG: DUF58 domain-containing protein [Solirubrobacteraceae bacterium]
MLVSDLIKKVKLIELKTKKTNDFFMGQYHSSFKGRGMVFNEVRPYSFGDEIRMIDWNKTAHFNEPYVKVFEEERELTLMLIIDISSSLNYGTRGGQTKRDTLIEICATLAFSCVNNHDKVGAILFSNKVDYYLPPNKGRKQVLKILRNIIYYSENKSNTETNIPEALSFFSKTNKRKTMAFILSDFENINYETQLKKIAKKHDLSGIRIYDEKEQTFPNIGFVKMKDIETKEMKWVDTSSKEIQTYHKNYYEEVENYFVTSFSKNGMNSFSLKNNQDYIKPLLKFFKKFQ